MRRILLPVLATLLALAACASTGEPTTRTGSSAASTGASSSDPSGTPSADAPADKATRRALLFGDSYFVGGGCSPDRNRDMAAIAARTLGYVPVVRGAGDTGFVAANEEYGIPPYLAQIDQGALRADDPSLVVIEGGSNDIGLNLRDVRRNARKVLTIARQMYPDARLILVGPMQTYGSFTQTDAIRDGLRKVARRLGVPFINPQKWTLGHDDWLCSDYVHPTYAGHEILGAKLATKLAKRGA